MMRSCLVSAVGIRYRLIVHLALVCLPVALLVSCGSSGMPTTPPNNGVDLAVTGHTVVKARTAGDHVVFLEERLRSLLEDGPDRTVAILQNDGHSVQTYTPPNGWSLVDFALH